GAVSPPRSLTVAAPRILARIVFENDYGLTDRPCWLPPSLVGGGVKPMFDRTAVSWNSTAAIWDTSAMVSVCCIFSSPVWRRTLCCCTMARAEPSWRKQTESAAMRPLTMRGAYDFAPPPTMLSTPSDWTAASARTMTVHGPLQRSWPNNLPSNAAFITVSLVG